MGLTQNINKNLSIKDVKQVAYFDNRYYKIEYEVKEGKSKKIMTAHLDSVTRILGAYPKDFLARWRGTVGNEQADKIIDEALKLGSFIHFGAEVIARGGIVIYNPLSKPNYTQAQVDKLVKKYGEICVCRFQKEYLQLYRIWQWFQIMKPTKMDIEQTVYSIKHQYAGTLDLLCWIEEGIYKVAGTTPLQLESGWYVADWKTGKGVDYTYELQISAYINAIQESLPDLDIKGGLIIHPNNDRIKNGIKGLKTHFVNIRNQTQLFRNFLKVQSVFQISNPVPKPEEFNMPIELKYDEPKPKRKVAAKKKVVRRKK